MNKPNNTGITRIISCGVFKPALNYLQLETRFPNLKTTYLQSNLHLRPHELREQLVAEFKASRQISEQVICLYGNCVAGIGDLCAEHGVTKIPGDFCHEILLGPEQFKQLMEETAGTYFVEHEVITNFEEHCKEPLELDDTKMKSYCFEHYHRLLYVRQPADTDIQDQAREIAKFLELSLESRDADYSYIEHKLIDIIHLTSFKDFPK